RIFGGILSLFEGMIQDTSWFMDNCKQPILSAFRVTQMYRKYWSLAPMQRRPFLFI
ncbi:hypothetical protein KI387_019038, partial [Taxus chinensis]